jgi:hypothetical protein
VIIHRLGSKVNFVDGSNVLVGWDTDQDCCELAEWWIATEKDAPKPALVDETDRDLSAYSFDPDTLQKRKPDPERSEYPDGGGSIAFRLVAEGKPELWLVLNNAQNGYYGHGFNVDIGGKTIWGDTL